MNSLKFIHTADIHLGKELSYNKTNNAFLQEIFKNANKNAFLNLVDLAIKENVDFILIAGDLYDRQARSIKASKFFVNQCQKLNENNIQLYIISGNHDPAGIENKVFTLPQNVHNFSSSKTEVYEYTKNNVKIARIIGQSYQNKFETTRIYKNYNVADSSLYNIALIHTALNNEDKNYIPCSKNDLLNKKNIDYWALGHLHKFKKINSNPSIYFPGTLQAHNISEEGNKGAILVELKNNLKSKEKFIELAPVNYQKITIDLEKHDKINNISELQRLITKKLTEILKILNDKNDNRTYKLEAIITRLIIEGRTKIHKYVDGNREELENTLIEEMRTRFSDKNPHLWVNSIIFKTSKPIKNIEEIKNNNPVFKNIDSIINEFINNSEAKDELLEEWGEIWQGAEEIEERLNFKFHADKNTRKKILKEAEKIIISELIEDGD